MAVAVGALRLASGVSFLVAPEAANRLWGDDEEPNVTTSLLLRSMGYRDALIGGVLLASALRGRPTAPWFLASAGADAAEQYYAVAYRIEAHGRFGSSTWWSKWRPLLY